MEKLCDIFKGEGLSWTYYSDIDANPRDFQVMQAAVLYQENNCDVVVALGGGSPMDAAKGIALVASNGGSVNDYEGANKSQRPLPPMLFLPSTAGSGSDISQFAIINDVTRRVKISIISRTLVPNISIIDPLILTTKTEDLIISAAIDALAHAVESFLSVIAFPLTEIQSVKAIDLIFKYLPSALETKSLDDLEQLSIASTAAAMAFSNASLGMDHALAHSLGGMLDVVHGLVHPTLLPPVMRYNLPACVDKVAEIGEVILGRRMRTPEATALAGIERIEEFSHSLGVATRLRDIVDDRSHLPQVCKMAAQDSCLLTNPRPATWEQMLEVCEEAW